jgi:hypothetical protein
MVSPMLKSTVCRTVGMLAPLAMIAAGCVTTEKSENPLSPTVAGPIAGVNITQPSPIEPAQGIRIANNLQPVTLSVQNAASTGVRPITYRFEVGTDVDFANVVFAREDVAPGADGRTSLRLPDALPTGRNYYWRGRAQDGANTGPYSHSVVFTIFTPVVIGKPSLVSPVGGSPVSQPNPLFVIGNAPKSGPFSTVVYNIELATNGSMVPTYASWVVTEQAGSQTSLRSPVNLAGGTVFYWRVIAWDSTTVSPWSDLGSFVTPASTPTPTPPGNPGEPCSSRGNPQGILECQRNRYSGHMSATNLVNFLKASATDINRLGTVGGPWGILVKTSGAQCNGYSCDILCLGNGSSQVQRDVLIDAEGSQIPLWGGPKTGSEIAVRVCEPQP